MFDWVPLRRASRPGAGGRRPRIRLEVEVLEERSVPAGFLQTNIVSDVPGMAQVTDPKLVNPWGVAFAAGGPFWVADNNSGFSTLYTNTGQAGSPASIVVPPATGAGSTGTPTGVVFNSTNGFNVSNSSGTWPAQFIFASEDGSISGWTPFAPSSAITAVDNANQTTGPVYKGLAIGQSGSSTFLYAADFRLGTVDVFNSNFQKVSLAGSFSDPSIPAGFAAFGIQNLNGQIYVTYAKQDPATGNHDDLGGAGNGYVDVYDTSGNFIRRAASAGPLNSPWGIAIAPAGFGTFGGDLLVGNFKGHTIDAFDMNGNFLGALTTPSGTPISIAGLWSLNFGGGGISGDPNTLYFTAGINGETHGLFGSLSAVSSGGGSNFDELGAYRPSDGSWSLDSNGQFGFQTNGPAGQSPLSDRVITGFSPSGSNVVPVSGDWAGLGTAELGDFENGAWHLDLNNNGHLDAGETFQFGMAGDVPVPGNYFGDGERLAVFRSLSNGAGEFIISDLNWRNETTIGVASSFIFGAAGDRVVVGDWSGNGMTEVGVFRSAAAFGAPNAAVFTLDTAGHHTFDSSNKVFIFGTITDGVVIGDWNNSGTDKVGVYRPATAFNAANTAVFSLDETGDFQFDSNSKVFLFGTPTDKFVTGRWAFTTSNTPATTATPTTTPTPAPPSTPAPTPTPMPMPQPMPYWALMPMDSLMPGGHRDSSSLS